MSPSVLPTCSGGREHCASPSRPTADGSGAMESWPISWTRPPCGWRNTPSGRKRANASGRVMASGSDARRLTTSSLYLTASMTSILVTVVTVAAQSPTASAAEPVNLPWPVRFCFPWPVTPGSPRCAQASAVSGRGTGIRLSESSRPAHRSGPRFAAGHSPHHLRAGPSKRAVLDGDDLGPWLDGASAAPRCEPVRTSAQSEDPARSEHNSERFRRNEGGGERHPLANYAT